MSQILRPVATIAADGNWAVTGAALPSDAVAESSADGDTSYIACTVAASVTIALGSPASTPASNGITLTIRDRVSGVQTGNETIGVSLYSGSTLLGTGTVAPAGTSYADQTVTITPAAVGDWTDLRVKLDGSPVSPIRVTQVFAAVADGATASGARTGRAARMLVNTCSINRPAESQATTGESVKVFTTLYSGVPCNVQTTDGAEDRQYARETGMRSGVAYFSPGTDILNGDQIITVAGQISGFSGCTLEVVSPPIDHAGRGAYTAVKWRETKGGP